MSASAIVKRKPRGISHPSRTNTRKARLARIKGGKARWAQRKAELSPEEWSAQGTAGGNAVLRKYGHEFFKATRLHGIKKAAARKRRRK